MEIPYSELTDDQRLDFLESIYEAKDKGDNEEAERLLLQIPLPVSVFKVAKAIFGNEYIQHLKDNGEDFSLVEGVYGQHYLN